MKFDMKKKITLLVVVGLIVVTLSGCGVDADPARALTPEVASGFWETFIVLPLIQFITFLYNLVGNLGISIMIATALTKLLVMPLMLKSMNSTAKMQTIQPQQQKIQQKYAGKTDPDSRMKQNQEMQALWKEHGVNPMAGCWPMLIQIPLMMAFFAAFSRHPLIATYNPSYFLGLNLGEASGWPNMVLAAIVAGLMYVSQTMMQKRTMAQNTTSNSPAPAMNPKMMSLMMIPMIALMVYGSVLAMGLYFLVTNIVMLLQNFLIKRPAV